MRSKLLSAALAAALLIPLLASAQAPKRDAEAEMAVAMTAAEAVAIRGPADISIKGQATMQLPADLVYIPQPQADQILRAMGNGVDPERQGVIFPTKGGDWLAVVRYIDSGYIRDEEAKEWDAEEMLASFKEGTEYGNKERIELGMAPMEIVGWVQQPTYDSNMRQLVWSIESKDKGAPADSPRGINYNTFVLGREGYVSLNLVTSMQNLNTDRPWAASLLAGTSFDEGKRYEDFNASTDRVAEYGIAALVAGAAAKKLGFFAVIAAFLLKFSKVIGIGAIAAFPLLRKLFRKKQDIAASASANDNPTF